jgi:hypothetical protein
MGIVAVETPKNALVDVCDHCGDPGDLYPVAYGDIEVQVHPYCRDAWVVAQDDLTIPACLRRGAAVS